MNAKPLIAWNNLVIPATLTASGENPNYPLLNLKDEREYLVWQGYNTADQWVMIDAGAGKTYTADQVIILNHNLFSAGGGNIALEHSANGSTGWTNCFTPFAPSSDVVLRKTFDPVTDRAFRLYITTSNAPYIGVLFIGQAMEIPRYPAAGFDPDNYSIETEKAISQYGYLLGKVETYRTREIRAAFNRLTAAWCDTYWKPFLVAYGARSFFWIWDETNHPLEVYYVSFKKPALSLPYDGAWRSLDLTMVGRVEQ